MFLKADKISIKQLTNEELWLVMFQGDTPKSLREWPLDNELVRQQVEVIEIDRRGCKLILNRFEPAVDIVTNDGIATFFRIWGADSGWLFQGDVSTSTKAEMVVSMVEMRRGQFFTISKLEIHSPDIRNL